MSMTLSSSTPTPRLASLASALYSTAFESTSSNNAEFPGHANLGATDAKLPGHTISSSVVNPNADKAAFITKMVPMPEDTKQTRSRRGGTGYNRKFLNTLSTRLPPINALLRHGVRFFFAPEMEVIVRDIMKGLATHPILVFPEWDAVADTFRLHCNASIDGFGAMLDQDPPGTSKRHIVFINHTNYDNERLDTSWPQSQ